MATVNKILGSSFPTSNTLTTLYTVPASTQTTCTVFISNQDSVNDDNVTVMLVPAGESDDVKWCPIGNGDIGHGTSLFFGTFALAAGDKIKVKAKSGYCSFISTGLETT